MQIKCLNGFFKFTEERVGECADFMYLFKIDLVPYEDGFTFAELEDPPQYAIKGQTYIGADVIKSFTGKPWEIFKANDFVFDFGSGLVVPKTQVISPVEIQTAGLYYISNGLIVPGSIHAGEKVMSYSAFYSFDKSRFRYSEVTYD